MILVVGATGQLGSLVVRTLREQGRPVRALVRSPDRAGPVSGIGAELVPGDLRDPASLAAALDGVEAVVATANSIAPSHREDSPGALAVGYTELISRAADAGVRRFVLASVPVTEVDDRVPEIRLKRLIEHRLEGSGLSYLSVRLPPFTEVWLSMVGSSLPGRGELNGTLQRPYRFMAGFRRLTGHAVDDHGLLVLPGPASRRHAFISVHDVADVLAASVDAGIDGAVEIGGPEVLSWAEIAHRLESVLGRPVRVLSAPAPVFALAQKVLAPFAPSAANVMGLDLMMATTDTAWDTSKVTDQLGLGRLRTVDEVLAGKAALAP